MFDSDYAVFSFDQELDALHEPIDVVEVQSCGRFIHHDEGSAWVIEIGREF